MVDLDLHGPASYRSSFLKILTWSMKFIRFWSQKMVAITFQRRRNSLELICRMLSIAMQLLQYCLWRVFYEVKSHLLQWLSGAKNLDIIDSAPKNSLNIFLYKAQKNFTHIKNVRFDHFRFPILLCIFLTHVIMLSSVIYL